MPTPTTFLTSLITSLSALSPPDSSTHSLSRGPSSASTLTPIINRNPPELPESAKSLLLTLHVLFPHVLLDALDLLDRGLVEKVCVREGNEEGDAGNRDANVAMETAGISGHAAPARDKPGMNADPLQPQPHVDHQTSNTTTHHSKRTPTRPTYYVRSAQPTTTTTSNTADHNANSNYNNRRGYNNSYTSARTNTARGNLYQVHLTAWNCSCPGFAFAAFGGSSNSNSNSNINDSLDIAGGKRRDESTAGTGNDIPSDTMDRDDAQNTCISEYTDVAECWRRRILSYSTLVSTATNRETAIAATAEKTATKSPWFRFGGLSLPSRCSGKDGTPPVCKHLLACVLAEECGMLFGGVVGEGTEEGGGIGMRGEGRGGDGEEGSRGVVERWVGEEERAGWAGGWGFA